MLRSFLGVGGVLSALVMSAGCHACLDGQDLGPGSGAGGNGGQTAQTTSSSGSSGTSTMETSGTTDAASSVSTSSNASTSSGGTGEGGQQSGTPCFGTDEAQCVIPPNTAELYQFENLCPHGDWCFYPADTGTSITQGGGDLVLTTDPAGGTGNGWWVDTNKEYAPLLFKRVTDDFVLVTRFTVDGANFGSCAGGSTDFKVGGLVVRDEAGVPDYTNERFHKLEYGCLGGTSVQPMETFGALWAQVNGNTPHHLGVEETASLLQNVGLAICRKDGALSFHFRSDGTWIQMTNENGAGVIAINTPQVSVGLIVGTYNAGGQTTNSRFDYAGFRTGSSFETGNCEAEVEDLDQALDSQR